MCRDECLRILQLIWVFHFVSIRYSYGNISILPELWLSHEKRQTGRRYRERWLQKFEILLDVLCKWRILNSTRNRYRSQNAEVLYAGDEKIGHECFFGLVRYTTDSKVRAVE